MAVPLTKGKVAIIDADDAERILQHSWFSISRYAGRRRRKSDPPGPAVVWMHREILQTPDGVYVDHVNHDGLDNRRSNLRHATNSQNHANASVLTRAKSGFRGVSRHHRRNRWVALLQKKYIGCFDTAEAAARAYDERARLVFGEFARLNFPNSPQ